MANIFGPPRVVSGHDLEADRDFQITYLANVAMLLHDKYNVSDFKEFETRNQAAADILNLIFGTEIKPIEP